MKPNSTLRFTPDVLYYPLFFVLVIWVVFWFEVRFGYRFTHWGVYPLKWEGLKGILFSPFIHGSFKHLVNNSLPLSILSAFLFYFYRDIRWKVLVFGTLLTGIFTWFLGRPAWHIGASGVIYMLAAFLFFKGILSKQYRLTALSLLVVFLYGGLVWYLLPVNPEISWEGHLSGFLVGLFLAFIFRKNPIEEEDEKYDWQKKDFNPDADPFLRQFDDDGNFIESRSLDTQADEFIQKRQEPIKIIYTYKANKEEE